MSPSDHEWAKEQIAAHLAGGLSAEDRTRLEAHASTCAECIAELDAARRFDRRMDELFAPIRPEAGLEDRIIRTLRAAPAAGQRSAVPRILVGLAAVALLGVLGFTLMSVERSAERVSPQEETVALVTMPTSGMRPPAAPPLRSADELASQGINRYADTGVLSDHHESFDAEESLRREAGKKDVAGAYDGRFKQFAGEGKLRGPAEPSVVAPTDPSFALELAQNGAKGKAENFYRLQNNAPASAPAPVAGAAFQPESELLAKVGADKQLKEARANERQLVMKPEPKPQAPGQQAQGGGGRGGNGQPAVQDPPAPQAERKIIRTGEVEYEIESFDSAVATISKIIAEEGGFVGTVNSDRLPNGKVRGTVVLRLAPDRLDILLLKLRGLGELKSQNIRSQDVTKQFYDLESRLRAARTMEERLLKIIKEGKGEIKDLLLAEKELGEWRTKIESFEGEIRYYASQISLSTLTVTLMEKEIRSPSAVTQTERVQMAVEVEDVEKSHKAALAAVVEAKGRVTRSELKQLAAGQFSALLQFEVAPDAAGLLRDRFKQLGNVARLDIDRVEETEGGSGKAGDVKVRQKDSQVTLSIYNLANVAPRETIVLSLACVDTEASYKAILARIEKAGGRVISSALNRMKNDQSSGSLSFEIKAADAEPVLLDVRAAGEVMRLDVTENPDTQNVTKSKRGFQVQIFSTGLVEPRETSTITIAAKSVPEAYAKLQDAAVKAGGRILVSQLNERDRQNVSATLQFDARRENEAGILEALKAAGEVLSRTSTRAQEQERVVDSKFRLNLTLVNLATIPPRETFTVALEVEQPDSAVALMENIVKELKGRTVDSQHSRDRNGQSISRIVVDVPLGAASAASERIKSLGTVRVFNGSRNPQAPEGELALARLDVTISNVARLISADSGPWTRIKEGLSFSLTALSWSLTLVMIGLCFVLPIGLIGWGAYRVYLKTRPKPV